MFVLVLMLGCSSNWHLARCFRSWPFTIELLSFGARSTVACGVVTRERVREGGKAKDKEGGLSPKVPSPPSPYLDCELPEGWYCITETISNVWEDLLNSSRKQVIYEVLELKKKVKNKELNTRSHKSACYLLQEVESGGSVRRGKKFHHTRHNLLLVLVPFQ